MAKSAVEKLEQIVAADPGSLLFVDLARALVDQGQQDRAIEVCRSGLTHNPGSIAGRVAWGRALLTLGRPSEAMEQFEQAIAVDRQSPYAYNLIGELLMQKGLHRSALPLLEKAAALQPGDARARGWLEQARRTLAAEADRPADLPVLSGVLVDGGADLPGSGVEATMAVDISALQAALAGGLPPAALAAPAFTLPPAVALAASDATQAVDLRALGFGGTEPPRAATVPAAAPDVEATMAVDLGALGLLPGAPPAPVVSAPPVAPPAPVAPPVAAPPPVVAAPPAPPVRTSRPDHTPVPPPLPPSLPRKGAPPPLPGVTPARPPPAPPPVLGGGDPDSTTAMDLRMMALHVAASRVGMAVPEEGNEESRSAPAGVAVEIEVPVDTAAAAPAPAPREAPPPASPDLSPPGGLGSRVARRAVSGPPPAGPGPDGPPVLYPVAADTSGKFKAPVAPAPPGPPLAPMTTPGRGLPIAAEEAPAPAEGSSDARQPDAQQEEAVEGYAHSPDGGPVEWDPDAPPPPDPEEEEQAAAPPETSAPPPLPPRPPGIIDELLSSLPPAAPPAPLVVQTGRNQAISIPSALSEPPPEAPEPERSLQLDIEAAAIHRKFGRTAIALTAVAALVAGAIAYTVLRNASRRDSEDYISKARNALSRDTFAAYQASAKALDQVLERDPAAAAAEAVDALVLARLAGSYGTGGTDLARARKYLSDPATERADPDLVLAGRLLLAEGESRKVIADDVIARAAAGGGPELQSLAGALYLERGEPGHAIDRFNAALASAPAHAPTLSRVGDYYRARGDHPEALRYYGLALAVSSDHPGALLGAAESHLARSDEAGMKESLAALKAIHDEKEVPVADRLRLLLDRARLLAAAGQDADGRALLDEAARRVAGGSAADAAAVADAAVDTGSASRAQAVLEAALARAPGDVALRLQLAQVLLVRDMPAAVVKFAASEGERDLHVQRGIAFYQLGDLARARSELRAAASDKGKLPAEAAAYLGLVDLASGQREKARTNLERLARSAAARAPARWAWAQVLEASGNSADAESVVKSALEIEPRHIESRLLLSDLLLGHGDVDGAVAQLSAATNLDPFSGAADVALVRALLKKGDPAAAMAVATTLTERTAGAAPALAATATVLLASGKTPESMQTARRAVAADPDSPQAHWSLGRSLLASGDATAAGAELDEAIRLAPRDGTFRLAMGDTLLAKGDAKAARTSYEKASSLPGTRAAGRLGITRVLLSQNKARDAERGLRSWLHADPPPAEEALLRAGLSLTLADQGKRSAKDAEHEAARALALDPSSAQAHLARGRALDLLDKRTEAAAELDKAAHLAPDSADVQLARGLLLAGRPTTRSEAEAALHKAIELAPHAASAAAARKALSHLR